jgi:hypothetical protein
MMKRALILFCMAAIVGWSQPLVWGGGLGDAGRHPSIARAMDGDGPANGIIVEEE